MMSHFSLGEEPDSPEEEEQQLQVRTTTSTASDDDDKKPQTKESDNHQTTNTTTSSLSLKLLIEQVSQDADAADSDAWDVVRERCQSHPDEMSILDDDSSSQGQMMTKGQSVLHQLCATPNAPDDVLQTVVKAYPQALVTQEAEFGATPLHMLMWTTLRSTSKLKLLLEHMEPQDLLLKNRFSGTALYSACGMNATLETIQLLVQKNPKILLERTRDHSHTSLTALWDSHLQSIPGHMAIARILKGEEDVFAEPHFQRFWSKVEYIAAESFQLSPDCPPIHRINNKTDPQPRDLVLLGLLQLRARINAIKVALKFHPPWASIVDANGNTPLHLIVMRRPYRLKDHVELISELLQVYPQAATLCNKQGDVPLLIGIRDKMAWKDGLSQLVHANPEALLSIQDRETGLYPFLLAASQGGNVAVNTTYELLLLKPDLVKDALLVE